MLEKVWWLPEICAPYFARLEHGQKNISLQLSMSMYPDVMLLSSTESIFFVVHKSFPSLLLEVLLLGVLEMQNCLDEEENRRN